MTHRKINLFVETFDLKRYLEIGVCTGKTFFQINAPYKVAVDPDFRFDPKEHEKKGTYYFSQTSDDFFSTFPSSEAASDFLSEKEQVEWDIIFIDGLHTFEQSFRDFETSLQYAHDKTIWIFDDTVPNDPYSSIPDQNICQQYREKVGCTSGSWHGDVFKTVFAIHDFYPDFSYCTIMDEGNPQTVLWKAPSQKPRTPLFSSMEKIAALNYFSIFEHAAIFLPIRQQEMLSFVGKPIVLEEYADSEQWKKLFYEPLLSIDSLRYSYLQKEATKRITALQNQLEMEQVQIKGLKKMLEEAKSRV